MGAIPEAHWLVAGLGNPGHEYSRTRHNVGFRVVECLAAEAEVEFTPEAFTTEAAWAELSGVRIVLLKPQGFMNLSGPSVGGWLSALELHPERLVVVHDDLDLPLGRIRLTGGAGSGGHRGVASIQATLRTKEFPRVRVGIGRPENEENAAGRVLGEFWPEELPLVEQAVTRATAAVRSLIREGLAAAMGRYNMRVTPDTGAFP